MVGGVFTLLSVILLFQTGRYRYLSIAGICAALTVAAVITERLVVTQREVIAAQIHQLASDLAANRKEAVFDFISDREPELERAASEFMGRATVKEARVKGNLQVEVFDQQGIAKASFNGVLVLDSPRHSLNNYRHARKFSFSLRWEDGRWQLTDYSEANPL